MKIRSLKIHRWRNLVDLHLDVPGDARFVCLVGENGTGKSTLLEAITWTAHQLGLAAQIPLRRTVPSPISGNDFGIEVTFATERVAELRPKLASAIGPSADDWHGDITFVARSWAGPTVPDMRPGTAHSADSTGGQYVAIYADGIDDSHAAQAGSCIVQAVRALPELLHLYIDADRVFPAVEVRDDEILALARQDPTVPGWLKDQASQMTQNLYLEWMRSMLGQQQRLQGEYFQYALGADRNGEALIPPADPLATYRAGLAQVLPHLRFLRLDQDARRLIFDSSGSELRYEDLSGGERELAFLVGQLDRFGVRDGLFLLDEPELHLNPELLRGWLDYLRSTVGRGQAWVATHSLEAAEIAGPAATLVMERGDDRLVRKAAPLADRPALSTLAAAVGTPAFSVGRSRFVLIEGVRETRERERFATLLEASVADRFIEADGCEEVISRVKALKTLASVEEQLRVAGIVDRDFRGNSEIALLKERDGVFVLPVHEIENVFLQPDLLRRLLADVGRDEEDALELLQRAADLDAGRWAFEKAKTEEQWTDDGRAALAIAGSLGWADIESSVDDAARRVAASLSDLQQTELARRRVAIRQRMAEYGRERVDINRLSEVCFGKQALRRVAQDLRFRDASLIEARAAVLWKSGEVARPQAADQIRRFLDGVPVLGG